jgi:2-keto-4-pentenoate hydratase
VGGGAQVLGSPVKAMRRLVGELVRYGCEPLRAGEFVSTGTLTQALPATPGGLWRGAVRGIDFAAIEVRLAKR